MAPSPRSVRHFLDCIGGERPFIVLGAGASYGLVPTTSEIRAIVKEDYLDVGIYRFHEPSRSDVYERIVGEPEEWQTDLSEVKLHYVPPGTLDLLVQRSLSTPSVMIAPPQYRVFEFLVKNPVFFSFNLDGLASRYLAGRHLVLNAHGTIDHELVHDPELIQSIVAYDLNAPSFRNKLLPGREPSTMTQWPAYRYAIRLFPHATSLVFIGYSFGLFQGRMDDSESFLFLMDLEKRNRKPVCVVSPNPDEVAAWIEDELKGTGVTTVPARWEVLAPAIERVALGSRDLPPEHTGAAAAAIVHEYNCMLDSPSTLVSRCPRRLPLRLLLGVGESAS